MIGLTNPWVLLGAAAIAFGAGAGVTASIKNGEIARLELRQAKGQIDQRDAALRDIAAASASIKTAAKNYQDDKTSLNTKLDAIRKDMKNAKPLPAGCLLDAERLRYINAAVDAANEAVAGQRTGGNVPAAKNAK